MSLMISTVINVNAWIMILNIIHFYFWDNIPVEDSIRKKKKQILDLYDQNLDKDIPRKEALSLFQEWINKAKTDCSFIYKEMKRISVTPPCRNFNDFIRNEELPFKNLSEMQLFINNHF